MQYTIQKKPVNYCSINSINCVPLEGIKRPIFYGFINTNTPQAIIYFTELEKIDFEIHNAKLYNSDLVYLRADFPNIEDILEELAPKSVRGNAKYRKTVEIDGVSYYCFKMRRFDCSLTYYRSEFLWSITDEMIKEAYPKFKSLYRAETITANRPQGKLEALKILSEHGIKIAPSAFKPTKNYYSNKDFYFDDIFSVERYGVDTTLLKRGEIEQRLVNLFNAGDEDAVYYVKSVLERIFGITSKMSYSQTKESFIRTIRTHYKNVNLIRVIELMILSVALSNPDIYFEIIKSIALRRSLNEYHPNVTEVIDYIYKMAIEDRLLTDNDVSNIKNILRGEPVKNIELEKVEVEKIDLKPIEREVINLEEIYKAKIASK